MLCIKFECVCKPVNCEQNSYIHMPSTSKRKNFGKKGTHDTLYKKKNLISSRSLDQI